MAAYRSSTRRAVIALGVVGGLAVAIAVAVAVGSDGAAGRAIGLVVAAIVLAATVAGIRALRRQAVVVEPGRVGRRGGWTGRVRWCELVDVRLVTMAEYRVLLGGTERNLLLWTVRGGSTGPLAALARAGMSPAERVAVADARSTDPRLRPFVVPLAGMRPQDARAVVDAAHRRTG